MTENQWPQTIKFIQHDDDGWQIFAFGTLHKKVYPTVDDAMRALTTVVPQLPPLPATEPGTRVEAAAHCLTYERIPVVVSVAETQ